MTILRLYLAENWPIEPACEWVRLGPDGRIAAAGRSEPRHWPAAENTEVVLAGSQCIALAARLPKAPRREQERLLRFAFEDQLILDPDSQHICITGRDDEQVQVLVLARDRLRQIVAQLEALGRSPIRVWAEIEVSKPESEGWTLLRANGHAVLHGVSALPFAVDSEGGLIPPVLQASVAAAREANRLPAVLNVCSEPTAGPVDLEAWRSTLGLPVEAGPAYVWHEFSSGTNLLQGEFTPLRDRAAWLKPARPALWLLGGVLAAEFLISFGQVLWQRQQLSDTRHTMQTVFQSAFPNHPLVDPVAQMRSGINSERRAHGLVGDDDLLPLLAATGEALGADARESIEQLRFDGGRLELTLSPRLASATDAIAARLQARGLQVGRSGNGKLAIRREIAR